MKIPFRLRKEGGGKAASSGRRRNQKRDDDSIVIETPAPAPKRRVFTRPKWPEVIGPADAWLAAATFALVVFGVVMVYSASSVYAHRIHGNGYTYLIKQSIFAGLGLFVMIAIARVDYHLYRAFTYVAIGGALVMMVVVVAYGTTRNGATRWLPLGPVHMQPAEVTKVALLFYMAHSLAKKKERIRSFAIGFLPHAIIAGVFMGLCLLQPDFGSAVMIACLTVILLFVAGVRLHYIIGAAAIALPVAYLVVASSAYRMARIRAYLDPFGHRSREGYQLVESLLGFGAGGVSGLGIGASRQKLLFLPEAHTDFISAIIGEELGLLGVFALIAVFVFIVCRGLLAAVRSADDYGTWLAVGVTAFFGLQAFTNLAVAMGLLPTKGLVLPFISYGGSSLLVNCAAMGVLLNVSRPRQVVEASVRANKHKNSPLEAPDADGAITEAIGT